MKSLKQHLNREKNFALTRQLTYNTLMHQGCSATGDDLCNCKETPEAPLITGLHHYNLIEVVKKLLSGEAKVGKISFLSARYLLIHYNHGRRACISYVTLLHKHDYAVF